MQILAVGVRFCIVSMVGSTGTLARPGPSRRCPLARRRLGTAVTSTAKQLRHSGVAGFGLGAGLGKQLGVHPAQRVIFGQVMAMPPLARLLMVVVLAFTMIVAIIVILIVNVIVVFVSGPSARSRRTLSSTPRRKLGDARRSACGSGGSTHPAARAD